MHIQCTYNLYPFHASGVSWTQETTYGITSRDNVRDHLKSHRTWSPRETTNKITMTLVLRDYLDSCRTRSPRETTYVFTSRMSSSASRCSDRKWIIRTWRVSGWLVIVIVVVTTLVKFCCIVVIAVCLSILQSDNLIVWRSSKVLVVIYARKSNLSGPISCQNITL